MSVQLSVFPQVGINTSQLANPNYNYLVDCFNWNSLNSSDSNTISGSASFVQNQINHYFPLGIQPGVFYRGFSTTVQVTNVNNAALFQVGHSCIIQKLTNIFPGVNYKFTGTVDLYTPAAPNKFTMHEYDGDNFVTSHEISSINAYQNNTGGSFIFNFNPITFSTHNPTIVLHYHSYGSSASAFALNRCFLQRTSNQPPTFNNLFQNGEVILDLYEDEDIPLTLSVDDFTKVAEKVQSYSKSFRIPQTKRNKRTFNDIFEITRFSDGIAFNPYMKTECVLKVDGILIFKGFLRLIDANEKDGEVSYNINLYSESVALKDVLEKRKIGDIDFSELEHQYEMNNIDSSWGGLGLNLDNALPTGTYAGTPGSTRTKVLKYPFVDWTHQYTYNTAQMPTLQRLEDAFRPWISCKYLIQRIFEQSPFTFKSDFFDSTDFENLYMDFNWGSEGMPKSKPQTDHPMFAFTMVSTGSITIPSTFTPCLMDIGIIAQPPTQYDTTTGIFTADSDNMEVIVTSNINVILSGSSAIAHQQINATINGLAQTIPGPMTVLNGGAVESLTSHTWILNLNNLDSFTFELKVNIAVGSGCVLQAPSFSTGGGAEYQVSIINVVNSSIINTQRGELSQWEFLSGFIKMFNLVTLPTEIPNEIQFEPYTDIFISQSDGKSLKERGVTHDWTEKLDVNDIRLKPLTDLDAKTIFKFVEDDSDYAFRTYKTATQGHLYGSKVFDASGATLLEGNEEIEAKPFASTVIKRLENYLNEFIVPAIYDFGDSGPEPFDNTPRILHWCGEVTMANDRYTVPNQNGVAGTYRANYGLMSHATDAPINNNDYDFVFGEQGLFPGMGSGTSNNLFNLYWLPYFNELYNPDTRTLTLRVNLTASDINTFNFSDKVFIKQRVFRVNKIDYKPHDLSIVEFILIP